MSWDETFSRYDEWSVDTTEDVAHCADRARQADGPALVFAVRVATPEEANGKLPVAP